MRERLLDMLAEVPHVEVVGDADNPADAIDEILRLGADVALLDLKLRGGSGLDVLARIKREKPEIHAIILTNYATPEFRQRCLEEGANHFFDKTEEFERVRDVLDDLTRERAAG